VKNLLTYYLIIFSWNGFDSIHSQGETAEFDSVKQLILNKNYNEAIDYLNRILIDNLSNYEAAYLLAKVYTSLNLFDDAENHFPFNRNLMIK